VKFGKKAQGIPSHLRVRKGRGFVGEREGGGKLITDVPKIRGESANTTEEREDGLQCVEQGGKAHSTPRHQEWEKGPRGERKKDRRAQVPLHIPATTAPKNPPKMPTRAHFIHGMQGGGEKVVRRERDLPDAQE